MPPSSHLTTKGEVTVLGISKKSAGNSARKAVSIFAALALMLPTFPLSSVIAHGDEIESVEASASQTYDANVANDTTGVEGLDPAIRQQIEAALEDADAQEDEAAAEELAADLLDANAYVNELEDYTDTEFNASAYDAISQGGASDSPAGKIAEAHPEHIYVALQLTDMDIDPIAIDASYEFVDYCADCLDENSEAAQAEHERLEEENRLAEEAVAIAKESTLSDEEVAAILEESAYEEPFTDPSSKPWKIADEPLDEESNITQPYAEDGSEAAGSSVNETSVQHPDYSIDVTLKDISAFNIMYSGNGSSAEADNAPYIGSPGSLHSAFKTEDMAIIKSSAFPAFSSRFIDCIDYANDGVGFKMQMPASASEASTYFDLAYGTRYPNSTPTSSRDYAQKGGYYKAISDATLRANFASTAGYDESRIIAYQNAYKLAPFASYEDIIKSGNTIPASHPLASKAISESWPIHSTDGMKVSLFEGDEENLVRYLTYFTDGTHLVSDMEYLGTRNLAASYVDSATGMLYQPDFWIIGGRLKQGVDWVADFIRSKTWSNYFNPTISSFTPKPDFNRTVRDYFDENIHEHADEVAANLVSYMEDWNPNGFDIPVWRGILNSSINSKPSNNASSEKAEPIMFNLLFFYTYYDRLFNVDMGGGDDVGFRKDANLFKMMAF